MLIKEVENSVARFLGIGSFLITISLWTGAGTDPVNVTKLWLTGGVAFSTFAIVLKFGGRESIKENGWLLIAATCFLMAVMNSVVFSGAPIAQTIFGVYGRNTGALTYFLLTLMMITAANIRSRNNLKVVLYSLLGAGILNVIYCGWVLVFGDFIPWNNPYGSILGTLGNPDFISAFLGLFIAVVCSFMPDKNISLKTKIIGLLVSSIALIEIVKSHAIQGLVVTAGGIVIVGFYVIRDKFKASWVQFLYLTFVLVLGSISILGTLQKGPFSFVYKKSVSLRGSYWHAGLEMGKAHPFTGVGMDSYGDWYRATRPAVALFDTPPVTVVSNVSHNVVIDFFAFGGVPLLLSYIGILTIGVYAIVKSLIKFKKYDSVLVGLISIWACYQVQSFISINQIGLAIWGWISTGALFAYSKFHVSPDSESKSSTKKLNNKMGVISPGLVGGLGLILGLIVALPPMNSDFKWRAALDSRNLAILEESLKPSLFNPSSSNKYNQAAVTLLNSKLNDLALKYSLIAVDFNPNNSDSWKLIYSNPNATNSQKSLALTNAKRLDPNNPDPFGLKQ